MSRAHLAILLALTPTTAFVSTGPARPRRGAALNTSPPVDDLFATIESLQRELAAASDDTQRTELSDRLGGLKLSAEMSVLSANAAFYDAFQTSDARRRA